MVEGDKNMEEKNKRKVPEIKVEIKEVANLKRSIIDKFPQLIGKEFAFKIITHNSPYEFFYEPIEGSFYDSVTKSLQSTDLKAFIERARKR